jgi:D-alanyl-D-alanine dipeptidase
MNLSTAGIPKDGLPSGFVYLDDWLPDAIMDAKYAGTDNFMGRPAAGYDRPLVVASEPAARAVAHAADALRAEGYALIVFDAYRPARAVADFAAWAEDAADVRRKPLHYPGLAKADMFALGYIARKSGHSRGSAVDLTLLDTATHQPLDMGTGFDFMGPRAHLDAVGLSPLQRRNRKTLQSAMIAAGFAPYAKEWWHFSLKNEPYPDQYFDFPIR